MQDKTFKPSNGKASYLIYHLIKDKWANLLLNNEVVKENNESIDSIVYGKNKLSWHLYYYIILDFGCGNGFLINLLENMKYDNITGLEPDEKLFINNKEVKNKIVTGMAPDLPFDDNSFDAIISMAVLHHLPSIKILKETIANFRNILKTNGRLFIYEPANTLTRKILTKILLSSFGNLTSYSRAKRQMVINEYNTLNIWLEFEKSEFKELLLKNGFNINYYKRGLLSFYLVASII